MEIHDISMLIEEEMPVYPGNPGPEIEKYREIPEESTTESCLKLGGHTGTHVDASSHVFKKGETVDQIKLENFYGDAQVINLTQEGAKITRKVLEEEEINKKIVLLKTENSTKQNHKAFREDYVYLTLEAVEYLISQEVKTVGIDYLSLVKFKGGEKAEIAHKKANKRMTVIEGLNLSNIEPGEYIFAGMPLKIETDGAPIRAALIE